MFSFCAFLDFCLILPPFGRIFCIISHFGLGWSRCSIFFGGKLYGVGPAVSNKKGGANAPHRLLWLILPHYVVWVKHLVLSGIQNKSRWPGQTGIEKREILCGHFSGLGPIYSNRIMFAHDLCAGRLWPLKSASAKDWRFSIEGMLSIRIKKTERSDTTNRHSSIVNLVPVSPGWESNLGHKYYHLPIYPLEFWRPAHGLADHLLQWNI